MARRVAIVGAVAVVAGRLAVVAVRRAAAAASGAGRRAPRRRPPRRAGAGAAGPQDQGAAVLRRRRRHAADERRARRRRTAKAPSSRRARSSRRRSRRSPSRSCRRSRRARRCARVFITEGGEAYVDLSREARRRAIPAASLNELLTVYTIVNALTANLPAVTVGADAGRRQGSRHAGRPRRSAAAAREESGVGTIDSHDAIRPTTRQPAPRHHAHARTTSMHAEGSVLIEAGRTQGDLHGERRGPRAAVPAQHRQGLGDRRVRHAAARHQHAHAARGVAGQGRRPHAGDSAADRPIAAGGDEPAGARRAHDLDRLRRHPGRRRHAHGVDHRRVRRAGAGAREAARARRHPHDSADRLRRRHQRRHRRRRAAARPGLRRRLAAPKWT